MGYKKRGYDKSPNQNKTRDYSLFAIACEGTEREPEYFRPFDNVDRIKVDIIENPKGKRDSAPKKILEKVKKYIEEVGLSVEDNDTLWCVIDVDKWPRAQINELAEYCNSLKNWNIIISNPCFEIWLLYHKLRDLRDMDCSKSQKVKDKLHQLEKGGYYYLHYLPLIKNAISNARAANTNPEHYFPESRETKVYLLAESLLERMGVVRFDSFIKNLCPVSNKAKKTGLKKEKTK